MSESQMAVPQDSGHASRHSRFQFGITTFFGYTLIVSVAVHQFLARDWTNLERFILATSFVGWVVRLAYGRARGSRGVVAAARLASICGGAGSVAGYFILFVDDMAVSLLESSGGLTYSLIALPCVIFVASLLLALVYHIIEIMERVRLPAFLSD